MPVIKYLNRLTGTSLDTFCSNLKSLSMSLSLAGLSPDVREFIKASGVISFGNALGVAPGTFFWNFYLGISVRQ